MQPFLTEDELAAGEQICRVLMPQLGKLNPRSCIAALSMCMVFASDTTEIPLESIFQMMRNLRKAFAEAQKAVDEGKLVKPDGTPLVVPEEPKIIVP